MACNNMEKIQQYYLEARNRDPIKPDSINKMPAILASQRNVKNQRIAISNFSRHKAGQTQFDEVRDRDLKTERNKAQTELAVPSKKTTLAIQRNYQLDAITSPVSGYNTHDMHDFSSSLDKITQDLTRKRAQLKDMVFTGEFKPYLASKRQSKLSNNTTATNVPQLPVLSDRSRNCTIESPKISQYEGLPRQLEQRKFSREQRVMMQVGKWSQQLPGKQNLEKSQRIQLINRNKQQRKMQTVTANVLSLNKQHTHAVAPPNNASRDSDSDNLASQQYPPTQAQLESGKSDQVRHKGPLGQGSTGRQSQMERIEQASRIYRNQLSTQDRRDGSQTVQTRKESRENSSYAQHQSRLSLPTTTQRAPNRAGPRTATQIEIGDPEEQHEVLAMSRNLPESKTKLQERRALIAGKQQASNAKAQSHVVGNIVTKRKHEVAPISTTGNPPQQLQGGSAYKRRSDLKNASTTSFKQPGGVPSQMKPAQIKVYLERQTAGVNGAPPISVTSSIEKSTLQKRIAQQKLEAQAYPVNNPNLKKPFKPIQISTRQLIKTDFSRSNSTSNFVSANSSENNDDFGAGDQAKNPYLQHSDINHRTLNQIKLKLPELVQDQSRYGQQKTSSFATVNAPDRQRSKVSGDGSQHSQPRRHGRKSAMHQSHTKSFELKALVQTSFKPVLVEQKEQQRSSMARSSKKNGSQFSKTSLTHQEDTTGGHRLELVSKTNKQETMALSPGGGPQKVLLLQASTEQNSMRQIDSRLDQQGSEEVEFEVVITKSSNVNAIKSKKKEPIDWAVVQQVNTSPKQMVPTTRTQKEQNQRKHDKIALKNFTNQNVIAASSNEQAHGQLEQVVINQAQTPFSGKTQTAGRGSTQRDKNYFSNIDHRHGQNSSLVQQLQQSTSKATNQTTLSKERKSIENLVDAVAQGTVVSQNVRQKKQSLSKALEAQRANAVQIYRQPQPLRSNAQSLQSRHLYHSSSSRHLQKFTQRSLSKGSIDGVVRESGSHQACLKQVVPVKFIEKQKPQAGRKSSSEILDKEMRIVLPKEQDSRDIKAVHPAKDVRVPLNPLVTPDHASKIRTAALTKAYGYNTKRHSTPCGGEDLIQNATEPTTSRKNSSSALASNQGLPIAPEKSELPLSKRKLSLATERKIKMKIDAQRTDNPYGQDHIYTQSVQPGPRKSFLALSKKPNADLTGVNVSAPEKNRDEYIIVKDGADKTTQNGQRIGKASKLETKSSSRHPSVTRQQIKSQVTETFLPRHHSKSPLKNNFGQTPTAAAYDSEALSSTTAVAKARQFDLQRRNKQSLQTLQVQKQSTVDQKYHATQEQKAKGLLKMIDSNASLGLFDTEIKKMASTPSKTTNQAAAVQPIGQVEKMTFKLYAIDDFTKLGLLGKGSFGEVTLVKHKTTGELFALKQIQKDRIRGAKHIQHVQNEKSIMQSISLEFRRRAEGSFFVDFIETMQDEESLYLLLEYLPGGELLDQIKQQMSLKMGDSVFYLAEILVAIQQLHERDIIYRDLKPENILIDKSGHIKLIDFGFSKQMRNIKRDKARTNCGTPAYAAPEVLIGAGYNYKVDIWSFGILICEMLGGFTPFGPKAMEIGVANVGFQHRPADGLTSMPPQTIIEMASSGQIPLPKNLMPATRDLVKRILVADPNTRLEIKDIMQHGFFRGCDWEKVKARTYDPPHVPAQEDPNLTSCQNEYTSEQQLHKPLNQEENSRQAVNESGTTYTNTTTAGSAPSKSGQVGSSISTKSSPQVRKTGQNKILGDYHLVKLNKIFEEF